MKQPWSHLRSILAAAVETGPAPPGSSDTDSWEGKEVHKTWLGSMPGKVVHMPLRILHPGKPALYPPCLLHHYAEHTEMYQNISESERIFFAPRQMEREKEHNQ